MAVIDPPLPLPGAYLVGVLNSDPESTRFQRSSAQITDSESAVVRGFAETPTGLAQEGMIAATLR
jgi:hypothetical protein